MKIFLDILDWIMLHFIMFIKYVIQGDKLTNIICTNAMRVGT